MEGPSGMPFQPLANLGRPGGGDVAGDDMNVHRRVDALRHMGRKRDGSRERCLWVILPTTLPVATPGAAIRQAVPFRLQACVRVRGCPAFIGSGLCVRDSAWIRGFSSTDSTTARSEGLTYSPTISCIFLPQSGSRDTLDVLVPVGASPWRLECCVSWSGPSPFSPPGPTASSGRDAAAAGTSRPRSGPLPAPRVSAPCPAAAWRRTEARRPPRQENVSATAGRSVWTCRSCASFPTGRSPRRDGDDVRAPCMLAKGLRVFHDACRALAVLSCKRDRCSTAPVHLLFASLPNPPKGDGIDSIAFPEKAKAYDLDVPLGFTENPWKRASSQSCDNGRRTVPSRPRRTPLRRPDRAVAVRVGS